MEANRTARGAKTLPGPYYTSEEIFRLENERIFARHWLYVGREAALGEPGRYFLAEAAGESIIVLRDQEGRLRAFYNVCRHRGTRLCSGPEGRFSHSIQCLYHAWTYGLDGALKAAP